MGEKKTSKLKESPVQLFMRDHTKQGSRILRKLPGFPGGAVVESLPASAGDTGSSPGLGRSHMPRATEPMNHNY